MIRLAIRTSWRLLLLRRLNRSGEELIRQASDEGGMLDKLTQRLHGSWLILSIGTSERSHLEWVVGDSMNLVLLVRTLI